MIATEKQRRYIANLLYQRKADNEWITKLFNDTPLNNDKYPDVRCNYQQVILADRLNFSDKQAEYIINAYQAVKGYKVLTARNIIIGNLIN
jgi:hypothetical protein